MLKLADEIVFAKTGQHLDDLQDAILRGTLQRDTYKEIAKDFDCSESRLREIGNDTIGLSDLLNALQSLSRRCLIEQQANFYTISPVLRQYAIASM